MAKRIFNSINIILLHTDFRHYFKIINVKLILTLYQIKYLYLYLRHLNCLTLKITFMNKGFDFYRIKMAYKAEADNGAIVPVKTEDLVMATCYTEAESIAYKLMEDKTQFGDVSYEITKTKISEVLYNDTFQTDENLICGLISYYFEEPEDTEVGLYAVSAIINFIDEKTGKNKPQKETFYVPATTPQNAIKAVTTLIDDSYSTADSYTIRNVKYDKAQSVMVTPETHQANLR